MSEKEIKPEYQPHECENTQAKKRLDDCIKRSSEDTTLGYYGRFETSFEGGFVGVTIQFAFCPFCGVQFEKEDK